MRLTYVVATNIDTLLGTRKRFFDQDWFLNGPLSTLGFRPLTGVSLSVDGLIAKELGQLPFYRSLKVFETSFRNLLHLYYSLLQRSEVGVTLSVVGVLLFLELVELRFTNVDHLC